MATYVALLRGINVGGKNTIKMADLKRIFEEMGLLNVKTYIQSGNVLFKSDETKEDLLKRIEHEIERVFGFFVAVILRTATELEQIIRNCPFSKEAISEAESLFDGETLYVALLNEPLPKEKDELLKAYESGNDQYETIGRDIFLLFHHSIRDSKLANNLNKLGVPITIRNWKTINKLNELVMERSI